MLVCLCYVSQCKQVLAHRWQTIPEKNVVRSRKPLKFWWAPTTISLERLIVSGAVNLGGRSVWYTGDRQRSSVYHTDCRHLRTARWARGTALRGSVSGSDTCLQTAVVVGVSFKPQYRTQYEQNRHCSKRETRKRADLCRVRGDLLE